MRSWSRHGSGMGVACTDCSKAGIPCVSGSVSFLCFLLRLGTFANLRGQGCLVPGMMLLDVTLLELGVVNRKGKCNCIRQRSGLSGLRVWINAILFSFFLLSSIFFLLSSFFVVPCSAVQCSAVQCRVVSCCVVSCRVVSCRVVSCLLCLSQVCKHYPNNICAQLPDPHSDHSCLPKEHTGVSTGTRSPNFDSKLCTAEP